MQHGPTNRRIAKYVADQLAHGESPKRVAKVLAAYLVANRQTRLAGLLLRDVMVAALNNHRHLCSEIISARRLSDDVKAELTKMLRRETGATSVELLETIDKDVVGGVIVRTPESELDASLETKLKHLKAI